MPLSTLLLTAIINFVLAALVYTKRHRIAGSNYFFWFVCFLSLWSISVFFYYDQASLIAGRLSFSFVTTSLGFLYLFGRTFTKQSYILQKRDYIVFSISVFFSIISITTSLMVKKIEIIDGAPSAIYGPVYQVFAFFILITLIAFVANALKNYRTAVGLQKNQIKFFLSGLVLFITLAVTSNLLLPLIGISDFSFSGPFFSIFFIMSTTYAITRHRLFDIKIQSQRIVNLLLPVALSAGITFTVLAFMPAYNVISAKEPFLLVFLLGIFCYAGFRYILLTTRLGYVFFHEIYEYRLALQNMAMMASTILDSKKLSSEIVDVFIDDMVVDKAAVLLLNTQHGSDSMHVVAHKEYTSTHLQHIMDCNADLLQEIEGGHSLYVTDELLHIQNSRSSTEHTDYEAQLHELLTAANTAMLIPLRAKNSLIGFIILGNKEAGFYTKDDIELLSDVSKELAIALANAQLNQQEKELAEIKMNILDTTSHQMRTPLSIIRNTIQMLLDDYVKTNANLKDSDIEDARTFLHHAFLASENLRNTLDTVLAVSELTSDGVSITITEFHTIAFLNERVERLKLLLNSSIDKKLNFNVHFDEELPKLLNQDKHKLALIIDQLLINAVLYTPEGTITFSVEPLDAHIKITVTDTGIGILEKDQPKLFQQFVRFENAKLTVPNGNGLSLYLAKQYINLLHGTINVESRKDEGSTFTVEVPV